MHSDYHSEKKQQLEKWLEENVTKYEMPKKITLCDFQINWDKLNGSFQAYFDDIKLIERFSFSPEQSGKPTIYEPVIHSPMGVPASFSKIEYPWQVEFCMLKQLTMLLPRCRYTDNQCIELCELNYDPLENNIVMMIKEKLSSPHFSCQFEMSYDFKIAADFKYSDFYKQLD